VDPKRARGYCRGRDHSRARGGEGRGEEAERKIREKDAIRKCRELPLTFPAALILRNNVASFNDRDLVARMHRARARARERERERERERRLTCVYVRFEACVVETSIASAVTHVN